MKLPLRTATIVAAALLFWNGALPAQAPADSALRRQQRTLDSLTQALRMLQARIDSLTRARSAGDTSGTDELAALRAAAAAASGDSAAATRPQQARLGQNALNPELTVTGDVRSHWGDPQLNPYELREVEIGFQSALDPYSSAKVFAALEDGEVDVEEAYLYYAALPGHVRVDAGKFRQTIGELNRWHLHALPEDEYPLVIRRYAGEEGLAAPGVSLFAPLPFSGPAGSYELTVQSTLGDNDMLFAGGHQVAVNAQLTGFWQLSRATFAQLSLGGLYGTNGDTSLTTTLGTVAARVSWRPPNRSASKEFTVRGELWALRRAFDLAPPDDFDATRLGGYADVLWRLDRRWVASIRGDYVQSPDPGPLAYEWAVTPTLTWWQSEFVYLRALYEHARDVTNATRDRFTIQAVFAMGPHKHESY